MNFSHANLCLRPKVCRLWKGMVIKMINKTGYIVPIIVLLAESIAAVIMLIRGVELYPMLWTLLIVFFIFYIIADIVRYIYCAIRPRVIQADDLDELLAIAQGESFAQRFMDDDEYETENKEEFHDSSEDVSDYSSGFDSGYDSTGQDSYSQDGYDFATDDTGSQEEGDNNSEGYEGYSDEELAEN